MFFFCGTALLSGQLSLLYPFATPLGSFLPVGTGRGTEPMHGSNKKQPIGNFKQKHKKRKTPEPSAEHKLH
jgi:hypothetical protein